MLTQTHRQTQTRRSVDTDPDKSWRDTDPRTDPFDTDPQTDQFDTGPQTDPDKSELAQTHRPRQVGVDTVPHKDRPRQVIALAQTHRQTQTSHSVDTNP